MKTIFAKRKNGNTRLHVDTKGNDSGLAYPLYPVIIIKRITTELITAMTFEIIFLSMKII